MDFKKKMKKFFTLTRKADGGFTLVELIVVIAILAVLAGITVPAYGNYVEKAKITADEQTLATMNTAFTVACMDKGEYDMTNLSFSPKATGLQTHVTVNGEVNDAFQVYFGGGTFQYFNDGDVTFSSAAGKFIINSIEAIKEALKNSWGNSNFNKDGMSTKLLEAYDRIGGYFKALEGTVNVQELLSNVSAELADALGLTGMAEGINNALAEEKIEQYLMDSVEGYAEMTDEQKAQWKEENQEILQNVKGNAAVLGFAEDAAGRTVDELKSSVDAFISVLGKTDDEDWIEENIDDEFIEEYYLSTLSDSQKNWYNGLDSSAKEQALNQFLEEEKSLGDFKITGADAVIYAKAAEGLDNSDTGVSGLASMYAIAAGFYNSEYAPEGGTSESYSDFGIVLDALSDPNFQTYYEAQGTEDLQAYLDFMSYLSTNSDMDMTEANAFTSQGGYIAEALGAGK